MLSPGRLRHRIIIRRAPGTEQNPVTGGYSDSWINGPTVWAEVTGLTGRESTIGQALQGVAAYRVTIRWRDDIGDTDQLRYGTIDLNIRSVSDPDGTREQLVIVADTASAQGGA